MSESTLTDVILTVACAVAALNLVSAAREIAKKHWGWAWVSLFVALYVLTQMARWVLT